MERIFFLMIFICSSFAWGSVPKQFKSEMIAYCGVEISPVTKKVLIGILRSEKTYFYRCDSSIKELLENYCPSLKCNQLVNIYHEVLKNQK